jgi:hypothetical protein
MFSEQAEKKYYAENLFLKNIHPPCASPAPVGAHGALRLDEWD